MHESYLRFANADQPQITDRAHFFRYAAHVMRSVIVDLARARQTERRGLKFSLTDSERRDLVEYLKSL